MRRPFAWIGTTCLCALAAAIFVLKEYSIWMAAAAGALFIVAMIVPALRKGRVIPVVLAVLALSGVVIGLLYPVFSTAKALAEQDYAITAQIVEPPEQNGERFVYELEVLEAKDMDGKTVEIPGKLRMTCRNALAAEAFDIVSGKIFAYLPGDAVRPHYAARGIYLSSFLYEYEDVSIRRTDEKPWQNVFFTLRDSLEEVFYTLLPEREAGFLSGIVLGDQNAVSEEDSESFRLAGVSHLLSVSGLHLSILVRLLMKLLGTFRIPRRGVCALSMPVVLGFMALTGFSYAVLRSGIMYLLYLLAEIINRRSDGLNSLGVAAVVLCVMNPFSAGDIGLLLSFSSTMGILLFQNRISVWVGDRLPVRIKVGKLRRPVEAILDSLAVTLASSVFSVPISVFYFGVISLVSPLANLLLVYPASILLALGIATVIVGMLSVSAALPLGFAAGILTQYEEWMAGWLGSFPWAAVSTSETYVHLWIVGTLILAGCVVAMKRPKLTPIAAVCSVLLLACGMISHWAVYGDCVSVRAFYSEGEIHLMASHGGRGAVLCGEAPDRYTMVQQSVFTLEYAGTLEEEPVELWDNRLVIQGQTDAACFFTAYGVSMLFCGEDCDMEDVPEEWCSPDILWLAAVPKNQQILSPKTVIVLDESLGTVGGACQLYAESYGRFAVNCFPDGTIREGRNG